MNITVWVEYNITLKIAERLMLTQQKLFEFVGEYIIMAKAIEAIYEKGVFRPLEKVDLKEGEKVKITIGIEEKTSRGLSKVFEKYIVKSNIDLTKMLIEERR